MSRSRKTPSGKKRQVTKYRPSKRLWREADRVAKRFGARVTALSSQPAVGVMGDGRAFGPAVIVRIPAGMSHETIGELSSSITNEVRGPPRVLIEVEPS